MGTRHHIARFAAFYSSGAYTLVKTRPKDLKNISSQEVHLKMLLKKVLRRHQKKLRKKLLHEGLQKMAHSAEGLNQKKDFL